MTPHVPEGYQVVVVDEDKLVRIYHMGREIVSARLEQLAAFFCWLSAERNALREAADSRSREVGQTDSRPTCSKCGAKAVSVRERREGFRFNMCGDCKRAMSLELRKLGISAMTSNAMARSGRLKEWTDFAKYTSESWIGVRSLGPQGRKQIAAALALYKSSH